MNPNVNLSDLNIGDNSGSTLYPNENIGDIDVLTPSRQSLLPPISPNSFISPVQQQQLESQYFGPGPSNAILRSMSLPSSTFSPLSSGTFSSIMFPSLPPVQRSPTSGLPPMIPSFPSFPSTSLSDHSLGLGRNFLEGLDTIHVGEHNQEESQRMAFHNVRNDIAPSGNVLTRSVSTDSFVSTIFTEEEMKVLKGDKKLTELAETNPGAAKRKLVNRAAAARSSARRLQCIAELQTKVKTLESELTSMQEYQIARDKAFNDLKIVHEETLKHMQTLRDWNDQQNAHLTEARRELNEYRREANMQQRRNP